MNLILGSPWWLVTLLMFALSAAAVEDAVRLRISNITSVAIFSAAIVAMSLHGFPLGLWQNGAVFVTLMTVGTAAFGAGWFGGGDVKLLAAIGLWLDFRSAAALLVAVALAGGILAIGYMGARWATRPDDPSKSRNRQIPYGVAIVFGTLVVFLTQLSHEPANSWDKLRAKTIESH